MQKLHIGIAGAGLAGRTLAWRLLRAGCRVSLFDSRLRGDTNTASLTAAAMLSPLAELAVSDDVVFSMGQRSMQLWPRWVAQLETAGHHIYYRQQGTLVVAHAQDRSSFEHFNRLLLHKLPESTRARVQSLNAAQLADKEPALAGRFGEALFLDGEGQLANDQWMAALALEIDKLGAQWFEGVAVDAITEGCIVAGGHEHRVDIAVDARGVASKALLPQLRGVRGEVLTVECRGVTLRRPVRLMHPRYQLYVAPRPDHQFVVGATELESEDTGPVTLRSMLELGSALYSLHPAFGEARVLRLAAALRPALDDHRPAISLKDGVWHINGLYRHGYLCAPALVDQLAHKLVTHDNA